MFEYRIITNGKRFIPQYSPTRNSQWRNIKDTYNPFCDVAVVSYATKEEAAESIAQHKAEMDGFPDQSWRIVEIIK